MQLRIPSMVLAMALAMVPSSAPSQPAEPKPVVAVFEIGIDGFDLPEVTMKRLTKYLGVRLMMGGIYQTAPESQLKDAMVALKLESQKDCYDDKCRVQLGLEAAANKNLNVTIWKVDDSCSIIGALYDLRAAASEDAAEVSDLKCDEKALKIGIARFAAQLGGRKGSVQSSASNAVAGTLPPPPDISGGLADNIFRGGDAPPPVKADAGYLSVEGSPKGARVDVNGPKIFGTDGKVATSLPMRPLEVPAGEYRVSVSMTGYDTEVKSVRVYADATEIVKFDLILSSGQIQISGKPDGAKSRLECQKGFVRDFGLPAASSSWTVSVPRGECRLMVERDGYEKYLQTFEVAGGSTVRQLIELKRDPYASGGVSIGTAGTKWIRLPGGKFQMGSNGGENDEQPVHTVLLSAFEIAATEVTVAQYRECVQAGACTKPHFEDGSCYSWNGSEKTQVVLPPEFRGDYQPVVCVDWHQAAAYAKWVGGRLPTEAEWEYAARSAGRNQEYPWGSQEPTCSHAIMGNDDDYEWGCWRSSTWPVCSKLSGNTAQGLCDMAGNVEEWVSDWYSNFVRGSLTNPMGPSSGSTKVCRGGSWGSPFGDLRAADMGAWRPMSYYLRATNRRAILPGYATHDLGFRPVRPAR